LNNVPIPLAELNPIFTTLKLADDYSNPTTQYVIDVLVGNDYYFELMLPERKQLRPGLFLLNSKLGWILSGRVEQTISPNYSLQEDITFSTLSICNKEIEDLWSLENIGIKESPDTDEDEQALANFNNTITCIKKRYYVTWLWKTVSPSLPSNYGLSLGRLESLLKRLKPDPDLLLKYNDIFEDQLKRGIIEKVSQNSSLNTLVHYIPHHPVIKQQSATTKVRIVFDASAKTQKSNLSLNECLFRGPVLLQDLCGKLLRFRLDKIAILSDIEKAFL